jgi:ABC-type proline/glycine betaine transport system permease subunit
MKLNHRRKLVLIGFLILIVAAVAMGIVSGGARDAASVIRQTLNYLTTPESIFFGLILAAIFALAKDEKH